MTVPQERADFFDLICTGGIIYRSVAGEMKFLTRFTPQKDIVEYLFYDVYQVEGEEDIQRKTERFYLCKN